MNLDKLIDYKIWSDNIYLDYCKKLTDKEIRKEFGEYKKSIRTILEHIAEVHWSWYETITTEDYTNPPKFETMTTIELIDLIKDQNKTILNYTSGNDLTKEIILQWDKSHKPVKTNPEEIIFNFVTHNAYHRGQIAIFLRLLGIETIKETDFNPYLYKLRQK